MKKLENPIFSALDNLAIIGSLWIGLVAWNWYMGYRAKYLFAKAYKLAIEKNAPYWRVYFANRIKEEMT